MQKTNSQTIFSKKNSKMEIIRLESDSEDTATIGKNKNSNSKEKIFEQTPNQIQEIINLEENVDNLKSNSQSSISTSTSHGNLVLNRVNNSAKIERENSSMFDISKRTKGILERIIENNKKAKLLEKMAKEKENNLDKNRFIGKKVRNNDSNSFDPKSKEKKLKLSKKTKEVIKKLENIRNNRFDDIDNKEQNNQIRKSSLLDNFISLDRTLNKKKLSSNKNFNCFSNIQNIIESYTHKNFSIDTLKSILYVVPHFYILKYVKTEKSGLDKNTDLMVDIPNDFNERINRNYPKNFNFLDINFFKEGIDYQPLLRNLTENELIKRKNIFINILNQIVNDFHNKFLKEKNIKIKFNPLEQKTWHHDFNPDLMCQPIPKFEIPEPPENKSIFEETINNNDIKKQLNLINNIKKKVILFKLIKIKNLLGINLFLTNFYKK